MAKQRPSVQKRQREFKKRERERKKREKAALKLERRLGGQTSESGAPTDQQPDGTQPDVQPAAGVIEPRDG